MATTFSPGTSTLQERVEDYISGGSGRAGKGRGNAKGREVIEFDMNAKDTKRIIEMGLNIAFICDTFGAGCVFYLWECLTDNLYV